MGGTSWLWTCPLRPQHVVDDNSKTGFNGPEQRADAAEGGRISETGKFSLALATVDGGLSSSSSSLSSSSCRWLALSDTLDECRPYGLLLCLPVWLSLLASVAFAAPNPSAWLWTQFKSQSQKPEPLQSLSQSAKARPLS